MEVRLQSLEIVEPAWYQAWPTRVFSVPTKRKIQSYVHMSTYKYVHESDRICTLHTVYTHLFYHIYL